MKKQNGFTLVEIAIVLVVIGLLLGGVLKGQELLENGRIRKALNDFNTVAAATFTYQDRYRQLPGDDSEATRFNTVTPAFTVNNGDGNGLIGDAGGTAQPWRTGTPATAGTTEPEIFWQHLRADGLIEGSGALLPANAFNGLTGVTFGNLGLLNEHVICMDNVTAKSAIIMDTRIDDGVSNTGVFIANNTAGVVTANAGTAFTITQSGRATVCREL